MEPFFCYLHLLEGRHVKDVRWTSIVDQDSRNVILLYPQHNYQGIVRRLFNPSGISFKEGNIWVVPSRCFRGWKTGVDVFYLSHVSFPSWFGRSFHHESSRDHSYFSNGGFHLTKAWFSFFVLMVSIGLSLMIFSPYKLLNFPLMDQRLYLLFQVTAFINIMARSWWNLQYLHSSQDSASVLIILG